MVKHPAGARRAGSAVLRRRRLPARRRQAAAAAAAAPHLLKPWCALCHSHLGLCLHVRGAAVPGRRPWSFGRRRALRTRCGLTQGQIQAWWPGWCSHSPSLREREG